MLAKTKAAAAAPILSQTLDASRIASRRTVGAFASLAVRLVSITFELGYRTSTSIPPGGGSGATRLALRARRIVFHASYERTDAFFVASLFCVWVNSD